MKKIGFLILAICVVNFTYGQAGAGLKAGLNLANIKSEQGSTNSRIGWYAGGLIQMEMSEKLFFRPELLYSIKGYAFPATVYYNKGTLGLHYLNLPLLIGYRASDRISVFLGPELGYLLRARSKTSNIGTVDVTRNYKRFDKGVDLGLTYNINKKLGAEVRYNYGIQYNVYIDPYGNQSGQGRIGGNRVLQFGFYCHL